MRYAQLATLGLLVVAFVACRRVPISAPREAPASGTIEIRLSDAITGEPIQYAAIVGYDWGQVVAEATPSGYDFASDGVHRRYVAPMEGRVRFAADGYSETWTERLWVSRGATRRIEVAMMPLSRIVVTVLDADGSPVEETTLHIVGPSRLKALPVRDGVAETPLDAGRVQVRIDPRFTEDYRPQSHTVTLRPRETTELTLRIERH